MRSLACPRLPRRHSRKGGTKLRLLRALYRRSSLARSWSATCRAAGRTRTPSRTAWEAVPRPTSGALAGRVGPGRISRLLHCDAQLSQAGYRWQRTETTPGRRGRCRGSPRRVGVRRATQTRVVGIRGGRRSNNGPSRRPSIGVSSSQSGGTPPPARRWRDVPGAVPSAGGDDQTPSCRRLATRGRAPLPHRACGCVDGGQRLVDVRRVSVMTR